MREEDLFSGSEDESLTPFSAPPFWRVRVLSGFISKSLCKINLADGTLFENHSTHLFRIIYTIVQNCKNHGIDPQSYMVDVLERLPHLSNDPEQIRQLQPKFWEKKPCQILRG